MPSFDLVSKLDSGEMKNAVNMAMKQIQGRYDFKGSKTNIELFDDRLEIIAEDDYKAKAALDILRSNMVKRSIGMKSVHPGDLVPTGAQMVKQVISFASGIDKERGKKINKIVKETGLKVTSSLLDEKIRLQGKKIDDLQQAYQLLKEHKDVDIELQMENMKR